jgi:ribose transport system substrate-binding protein
MRKSFVSTGLAVTAALALLSAGCSASNSSAGGGGNSITLAGVLANTSDPFWTSVGCGAKQEAKKLGVTLRMYNSTSTDTNQIASNFQSATLFNPSGILSSPFNNNQFIAQYKSLMAKGIPVVSGNGTSPQTEYKNIFSGSDTAKFATDVLKGVPAGAGSMVYLGGAPGIPPLETRTTPFVTAVKSARADLRALPTDYSGFDINKETSNVSALILAHPDLKLVIAADGPDAVGAAAAIKQAGKQGKITLVGFDAIPAEVAALKNGAITALIAQGPFTIGRDQVDALVDYLKAHPNGGAVQPSGDQTVANALLTKDNIDDPASADYVYTANC